jgi:hypothetical protein
MLKASNELSGNSRLFKTYVRTEKRPDGALITVMDYWFKDKNGKWKIIESKEM